MSEHTEHTHKNEEKETCTKFESVFLTRVPQYIIIVYSTITTVS